MRTKKLPDETKTYNLKDGAIAHTLEKDGFEKLIVFTSDKVQWVHRNYQLPPKKRKKKQKK